MQLILGASVPLSPHHPILPNQHKLILLKINALSKMCVCVSVCLPVCLREEEGIGNDAVSPGFYLLTWYCGRGGSQALHCR